MEIVNVKKEGISNPSVKETEKVLEGEPSNPFGSNNFP